MFPLPIEVSSVLGGLSSALTALVTIGRHKPRHLCSWSRKLIQFSILFTSSVCLPAQIQAQAQMRVEADRIRDQAAKLDVTPVRQGLRAGEPAQVAITLKKADNTPVPARTPTTVELETVSPSGKQDHQFVTIPAGQSSAVVSLQIGESGLTKLHARHPKDELLDSSNYLYTLPSQQSKGTQKPPPQKPAPHKSIPAKKAPITTPSAQFVVTGNPLRAVLLRVSFARKRLRPLVADMQGPPLSSTPGTATSGPRLLLQVSGERDGEVDADGQAHARVAVYLLQSDPAPHSIRVWLTWSNGSIGPNPLTIKQSETMAEAAWTSAFPIDHATVSIASSSPQIPVEGGPSTVRFVRPIRGIAFVNPPDQISLIDAVNIPVRFFDSDGKPIPASAKTKFRFASNTPILRLSPETGDVRAEDSEFTTSLLPTSIGSGVIEASSPGYQPATHQVRVTVLWVLILCLVGGVLGSVAAHFKEQGSMAPRILVGVVAGMLLTWAYVWGALPNTYNQIVHSQISVLLVSVVGGLSGTKALNIVLKFFGTS